MVETQQVTLSNQHLIRVAGGRSWYKFNLPASPTVGTPGGAAGDTCGAGGGTPGRPVQQQPIGGDTKQVDGGYRWWRMQQYQWRTANTGGGGGGGGPPTGGRRIRNSYNKI